MEDFLSNKKKIKKEDSKVSDKKILPREREGKKDDK